MSAAILDVADAVVTALNAATLSAAFTAVRGYIATHELPDMDTLRVTVMPAADDIKRDTRSSAKHRFTIDVGVQKKPSTVSNAMLDPLTLLAQEIADYFLYGNRTAGAILISPEIKVLFIQKDLRELGQFTAVVRLQFDHWRDAA